MEHANHEQHAHVEGHNHGVTDPGHSHTPPEQAPAFAPAAAEGKPKKEKKAKEPKAPKAPKIKAEKPIVVKAEKDTKNGMTRPGGGVTKLVWDTADKLSTEKKAAVERAALVKELEGKVEVGTIHTQYGRWRKYYGLTETKEQRQARLKIVRDKNDAEKKLAKDKKVADKAAAAADKAVEKVAEADAAVAGDLAAAE